MVNHAPFILRQSITFPKCNVLYQMITRRHDFPTCRHQRIRDMHFHHLRYIRAALNTMHYLVG